MRTFNCVDGYVTDEVVQTWHENPSKRPAATKRGRDWEQEQFSRFIADDGVEGQTLCLPWTTLPGHHFSDEEVVRMMGHQIVSKIFSKARAMKSPKYHFGRVRLRKAKDVGAGVYYCLHFTYDIKDEA